MPIASSTALITSLTSTFYGVLSGPVMAILGVLLTVSVVFYAYNKLVKKFKG
jgi:hypothetical protein